MRYVTKLYRGGYSGGPMSAGSKPPKGGSSVMRAKADDDYWWRQSDAAWEPSDGMPTSITVVEEDRSTFSGLYDHEGNELHREREPVGFRLSKP